MKKERQQRILEIIAAQAIDTQEDLQEALRQSGFPVTQATVSRDMKELRLVKGADSNGRYRYISQSNPDAQSAMYKGVFANSVISVESAMNDVVIKCYAGTASGAAAALDHMKWSSVVGTISGDDTILAITRDETSAKMLETALLRLLGK